MTRGCWPGQLDPVAIAGCAARHQPDDHRPWEDMMGNDVRYRRIYDGASPTDGLRILVDRLWPRGLRKQDAHLDEWARDVAPSTELRLW